MIASSTLGNLDESNSVFLGRLAKTNTKSALNEATRLQWELSNVILTGSNDCKQ